MIIIYYTIIYNDSYKCFIHNLMNCHQNYKWGEENTSVKVINFLCEEWKEGKREGNIDLLKLAVPSQRCPLLPFKITTMNVVYLIKDLEHIFLI